MSLLNLFGLEDAGRRESAVLTSNVRAVSKLSVEDQKRAKEKKQKKRLPAVFASVLNVRPSYSTVYTERLDDPGKRTAAFEKNKVNLRSNDARGKISKKARLNIQTGIDWLVSAAREKEIIRSSDNTRFKFKVNFITLTLPASQFYETEGGEKRLRHSDQVIKSNVLAPFLDVMRRDYSMKNYLWRAEAQSNGNIHFHLLTDVFIHYEALRRLWNDCLERLGYISRFESVHGHRNPNSTDVHSVRKIRKLGAYLTKYMAKDGKGRAIAGRQWFLSVSLSRIGSLKIFFDDVAGEVSEVVRRVGDGCIKSFDYCKVLLVDAWKFCEASGGVIKREVEKFLDQIRSANPINSYQV